VHTDNQPETSTGPLDEVIRGLWPDREIGGIQQPGQPPEPPSPPIDFIAAYADYADVLEAPRMMHEVTAMQMVATVLNRNGVVIENGASQHPLDLWTLLLSGSGLGRSTLVGQTRAVLKSADLTDLVRDAAWGSEAAFIQNMAENPAGMFVWGELSEKLKKLNESRFAGIKEWITDRYDDLGIPEARRYRTTGKSNDTPPIEFTVAPRINILATSSEAWFFNNLTEDDSAGGFVPRWLLIRSPGRARSVPTPRALDRAQQEALAACLRSIAGLQGSASIAQVQLLYDEWYRQAQLRFEGQPNRALASAYFNRHRVHVLKLAVIYEAASSQTLAVGDAAWRRAVAMAAALEATIFSLLDTGMNAAGYALKQMEERVRSAGPDGLSKSAFTKAFHHVSLYEREANLKTLLGSETIRPATRPTSGRSATIYIHRVYAAGAATDASSAPGDPSFQLPSGGLVKEDSAPND
jgi:hypothetical protein